MAWTVEFLDDTALAELEAMPADIKARFARIVDLIEGHGLERVGEPHIKHLQGKLWEMRMKGRDGIARSLYVTATGRRGRGAELRQEDAEDPASGDQSGPRTGEGGRMSRKFIPAKSAIAEWRKDPAFTREYEALADEFALATQLIEARARAGLTQAQLA